MFKDEPFLACLSQLSASHGDVIDLIYFQEKSVEEVARIVGVPAGTVKTRTFYSRHRMAELLDAVGFSGLYAPDARPGCATGPKARRNPHA